MRAQLAAALMLLTRFPAVWLAGGRVWASPGQTVWAFPLVGALVGLCAGLALAAARWAGLPPAVAAGLALAMSVLATGGLHEDGLADAADGFGGGRDRAAKLRIMRDSRIGSYGVLALVLALGLRWAALAAMTKPGHALVAAGALSRAAMVLPMLLLRPAREGGLGASVGDVPAASALGCLVLALGVAMAALGVGVGAGAAAAVIAAAVGLGSAWLGARQIGGYTGDLLGACAAVAETAVLIGAGR